MKENRILIIGLLGLCGSLSVNAQYISTATVPSGSSWTNAYWQLPPSTTLIVPPAQTAGNTFTLVYNGTAYGNGLNNTRMRNPSGVGLFPGDSLTLNTNTELRIKNPGATLEFPGPAAGGPGLILNGGVSTSGMTSGPAAHF